MLKSFINLDLTPVTRKEADGDPADPTIGRHSKRCKDFFQVVKNLILGATFYLCCFLTPAHIDDASEHSPLLKAVNLQQHKTTNYSVIGGEKLDPVGSTVRYEMMKLCTGSV